MPYYALQYDLSNAKDADYPALWKEMDRLGGAKYQDSAYFLETGFNKTELLNHLKPFLHADDRLMIVPFSQRPRYTKAEKEGHDWIVERFK